MQLSAEGLDLIKKSEGFRDRVYLDVAGFPTIGYGHLIKPHESFPNGVTEPQAAAILSCDVQDAAEAVARLVKVALTQGQFDALVDFCFNLGAGRRSTDDGSLMPPSPLTEKKRLWNCEIGRAWNIN